MISVIIPGKVEFGICSGYKRLGWVCNTGGGKNVNRGPCGWC